MKKLLKLFLLMFVAFFCFACHKKEINIGLLIYTTGDKTVDKIVDEIQKNINPTYNLIICDAEKSQSKQNQQFLELLEDKVDLLIVNLVDRLVAQTYVEKCKSANCGIIFFNREPVETALNKYDKAYYIGTSGDIVGENQAKIIRNMFINPNYLRVIYDKNGNNAIEMVILKGEPGHQLSDNISEKCLNKLRDGNFSINILASAYGDWNRETAKEKMSEIYFDPRFLNPDGTSKIELVISTDDQMALGIIDFIFENDLQYERNGTYIMPFSIVGANMSSDSEFALNEKYIYGTITSEIPLQAQLILETMEKLLNNSTSIFNINECDANSEESKYCSKGDHFIYVTGSIICTDDHWLQYDD